MTIRELDVVKVLEDMPDKNLTAGMIGTVIHIFTKPNLAYEVEFCDDSGRTVEQRALWPDQVELVWSSDRKWNS